MDVVSGRLPKRRLDSGLAIGAIANILPDQKLIAKRQKTADMIRISYVGLYGENDFRRARLKEDRSSAGKAGGHQVKKNRYPLDIGAF